VFFVQLRIARFKLIKVGVVFVLRDRTGAVDEPAREAPTRPGCRCWRDLMLYVIIGRDVPDSSSAAAPRDRPTWSA
jgi:hypothetical protein